MSVRKRKWIDAAGRECEAWMIHVKHTDLGGKVHEVRKVSPVNTRRGAEQYERDVRQALVEGSFRPKAQPVVEPEPTTVREFVEPFLDGHGRVEGLRPIYVRVQRRDLTKHVLPVIGDVPVSTVGSKHFGLVKRAMLAERDYAAKTINNVLATLSRLVQFWYERDGLDPRAFRAGLVKVDEVEPAVCDPAVYSRMVKAAKGIGPESLALLLLMGDAGLRQGEVRGLAVGDVRLDPPASLRVQRALSRDDEEHSPKSRRNRTVPMTARLHAAMAEHLSTRGRFDLTRVFVRDDGESLLACDVQARLRRIEVAAGVDGTGRSHHLRHMWATELAAAGVTPRVIQELAGHADLKTTLRYMHLQEGQTHAAIAELERRQQGAHAEHTKVRPFRKRPQ